MADTAVSRKVSDRRVKANVTISNGIRGSDLLLLAQSGKAPRSKIVRRLSVFQRIEIFQE